MGLFWRRKSKDQFISLGLSEPRSAESAPPETKETEAEQTDAKQTSGGAEVKPAVHDTQRAPEAKPPIIEPAITGAGPTPVPIDSQVPDKATTKAPAPPKPPVAPAAEREKPQRSRTPFATSVLGLNLTIEELQAQEAALEREFSARFRRAVSATRESISERLDNVFQGFKQIDENLLDELEEALIAADIGVATTTHLLETVRRGIARNQINDLDALKQAIKSELLRILKASEEQGIASEASVPDEILPYVMMIVGVNGVGKTTTIGKLAQRIKAEGNDVLICAADTFRAAASDQLAIWAQRTGVPLIQQKQGTDPAAVLFDSLKAAKARGSDVLIVDTAGRLHTKSNLMAELEKMKRVAGREVEGAPHETLLVVDAVTGQNGLEQARQFLKVAGVTGIVLTKLDGTAKGGIAVAIAKELNLPIRYAGIGEKVDDLVVFDPEQYVNGLFE